MDSASFSSVKHQRTRVHRLQFLKKFNSSIVGKIRQIGPRLQEISETFSKLQNMTIKASTSKTLEAQRTNDLHRIQFAPHWVGWHKSEPNLRKHNTPKREHNSSTKSSPETNEEDHISDMSSTTHILCPHSHPPLHPTCPTNTVIGLKFLHLSLPKLSLRGSGQGIQGLFAALSEFQIANSHLKLFMALDQTESVWRSSYSPIWNVSYQNKSFPC